MEKDKAPTEILRYRILFNLHFPNNEFRYNFSQKLDQTTADLKRTADALEKEKARTDMLLYQMLPVKVANSLRDGQKVEAGRMFI